MLSMLGTLKNGAQASERPVLWLHAAENGRQHAFRDYITGLARAHPDDVTRRVWYNHPNPDDVMGSDNKVLDSVIFASGILCVCFDPLVVCSS